MFQAKNVVNGSFGKLYIDGKNIAEISEFELKIKLESKDVQLPNGQKGKKNVSASGEGKIKIQKVYSYEFDMLKNLKAGLLNSYYNINVKLDDPEALGAEAIAVNDILFTDEIDLMSFKPEELVEREFTISFIIKNVDILETIEDM